jgi:hypothetical protein
VGSLKRKYAKVRKFNNMPRIINEIIKDNELEILAMNRDQMYEDGIMNVMNEARYDYAPGTAKQKQKRARYKRTDHITLRWTGSLYNKMKLVIKDTYFYITSTDEKWAKFSSGAWGQGRFENALGLTAKNKAQFRGLFKYDLILKFRDAVQNT